MNKIILFVLIFTITNLLFSDISLKTELERYKTDDYVLKAIFTIDSNKMSDEGIYLKEIPISSDYNILNQSYSEIVSKNGSNQMLNKIFSFHIKPLKVGKIKIDSLQFTNSDKSKRFLTVPKEIIVKDYHKLKRYGEILILVVLFFITCFLLYIWINRRKQNNKIVESEDTDKEVSSVEEILQKIDHLYKNGNHKEIFPELDIVSNICGNEEFSAKIKIIVNDYSYRIKYGGENLTDSEISNIKGILQQILRNERDIGKSKCPNCGAIVSDSDTECHECGSEFDIIE